MKILIHTCWGLGPESVGGTEKFVLSLARKIRQRGDDAFLVCSNLEDRLVISDVPVFGRIPERYRSKVKKYGYANELFFRKEVIGPSFDRSSIQRFSDFVAQQIMEFNPDVIHLNSFLYSALLPVASPFTRMIVTNHECPEEIKHCWGKNAFDTLVSIVGEANNSLKRIATKIVPSTFYAQLFSDSFCFPVRPIPLGVDNETFGEVTQNYKLRTAYARDDEIIILMPSRFDVQQKGHDIAISALGILKKEGLKFKAIFSGYDKDAYLHNGKEFFKMVRTANLDDTVFLTRFDDIREAYSIADIVISPERFCSYGLAVAESLSLGLPTILAPNPTYIEIASGSEHASFTRDHSPKEFASRILAAVSSGIGRNESAAKRFREEHSFERCVDAYYDVYADCLNSLAKR